MSAAYKKRFEVIFLVDHPKGPNMSVKSTAKYTKTSVSFVKKWIKRFKECGNVDDELGRGRKRATSKGNDKMICELFTKNPTTTLREGQQKLIKKGVRLSLNTLRSRLQEIGIKNRSTIIKPLLTEKHIENRLNWANANLNRDWSNIIFTDESSFIVRSYYKKAWSQKGEQILQRTVKHPAKVHVYGCFSSKGFGRLIIFTRNLDANLMVQLYKKGLLKSAEKLYGPNNHGWILQEDNDPKHRSRLCTSWKEQNGITTLDWPSQSPDANPIENVWSLMKTKLKGKKIHTTKQLTLALKRIWSDLSLEYAQKLSESCIGNNR